MKNKIKNKNKELKGTCDDKSENFAQKNQKNEKTNNKKSSFLWLFAVSIIAVALLLFCQFYFGDPITENTTFYQNTKVNGIDVSGLTKTEATQIISQNLTEELNNLTINLKSGEQTWEISGKDFEYVGNIENPLTELIEYGRTGNIFEKKKVENKIKEEGLEINIPYNNIFGGMQEKIDEICNQIEIKYSTPQIKFDPNAKTMFSIDKGQVGYIVDKDTLNSEIDKAISQKTPQTIEIPLTEVIPETDYDKLLNEIGKVSQFSTSYSTSSTKRKNNIKKALSCFNGMIVMPNQEISFNETTGPRTKENGYENANIIIDGNYVSGTGGGVCQASTTLYNALLLANMEILSVHHHSLPASYVPLSFDAMVSEGYADLIFKNTSNSPIFIKTICDENNVTVEIYGKSLEDNLQIKTRTELVKIIPHKGDKILTDTEGKYTNQVLYKGEYYRLKYPKQGYESKGYLQYYKDGELVEEKMIRHDHYQPQMGIIVEGTEQIEEGMTLPSNGVKFIPPQKI